MRKLLLFLAILCMVACKSNTSKDDYVDLGLSSGTLWKSMNEMNPQDPENGFYTYDEAVATFGNKLPTKQQWMELVNECTWTWTGMGYRVVGYNGNSIVLPAAGLHLLDFDTADSVGSYGYYWSSTPCDSHIAWFLYFNSLKVNVVKQGRSFDISVRLVR